MNTIEQARERLELAQQRYPYCTYCGSPMDIVARDGQLWIECVALTRTRGIRHWFAESFHDHRWITEDVATPLAA